MAANTYSGLPRDKQLAIQSYGNWIFFVTFTFPDPIDPVSVRPAGEYLRKWLRSQGNSYVCVLELDNRHEDHNDYELEHYTVDLAQETLHRPHYHVVIDRYLDQQQLNRIWYQALHATAKVDIQRVEAEILEKLYSYVQKQQKPAILRRVKAIYHISYTLRVEGHLFSLWLNHVHSVLVIRNPPWIRIGIPLFAVPVKPSLPCNTKPLDLIETGESMTMTRSTTPLICWPIMGRINLFLRLNCIFQLDQCQFYHRHPLVEPFRTHLATLDSTLVSAVLIFFIFYLSSTIFLVKLFPWV